MSRDGDNNAEYNERYPNFRYELLDEPPEDWELYDIPDKTHLRNRALDLGTYKRLVRHHSWGFDVSITDRKTKHRLLERLKRIIYSHDPNLRPSWHAFVSRNCDAGPRLLKRKYNALQISRWFPDGVPGQPLRLGPLPLGGGGGVRSSTNLQNAPITYHQGYGVGNGAMGPTVMPANQPGFGALPSSSSSQPMGSGASSQVFHQVFPGSTLAAGYGGGYTAETGNCGPGFFPPAPAPAPPHTGFPQNQQGGQIISTTTLARSSPAADLSFVRTLPSAHMPDATPIQQQSIPTPLLTQPVVPSGADIAQATMGAFRPLAPKSSTPPTAKPPPLINAAAGPHLRLSVSGEIPSFVFNPYGTSYPYHGRGPMSAGPSDAVDCLVVVGKLLDLAQTAGWKSDQNGVVRRSIAEDTYIDILSSNLNGVSGKYIFDKTQGLRNVCRERLYTADPFEAYDDPSSPSLTPANVWEACTGSFPQFHVQYTETVQACSCQGAQKPEARPRSAPYITTDARRNQHFLDTDLDSSIRRFFQCERSIICGRCMGKGQNILSKLFTTLPSTLAIRPDPRVRFRSHSSDEITIEYADSRLQLQNATYRWLGGIYPVAVDQQVVHKVFWNDRRSERGKTDSGALRVYDAAQIFGAIVGGVNLGQRRERVPASRWAPKTTPLLFYELVAGPSLNTSTMQNVVDRTSLDGGDSVSPRRPAERQVMMSQENGTSTQARKSSQGMTSSNPSGSDSTIPTAELSSCYICSARESSQSITDSNPPRLVSKSPAAESSSCEICSARESSQGMASSKPSGLGSKIPTDGLAPCYICSRRSAPPHQMAPSNDGQHSQHLSTQPSIPYDLPSTSPDGDDNTKTPDGTNSTAGLSSCYACSGQFPQSLTPSSSGTIAVSSQMPRPQPAEPPSSPPALDQDFFNPLSSFEGSDVGNLARTENPPAAQNAFSDNAPEFPPLPDLGGVLSSMELDWLTDAPAEPSSSPSFETAPADNNLPVSISSDTAPIQSSQTSEPASQNATSTTPGGLRDPNNSNLTDNDAVMGFEFNSTGFNVFDEILNNGCAVIGSGETQPQQQLPQQPSGSQGLTNLVSSVRDTDDSTTLPTWMEVDHQPANTNNNNGPQPTKRKSVAGTRWGEEEYGGGGDGGDAAQKRARR